MINKIKSLLAKKANTCDGENRDNPNSWHSKENPVRDEPYLLVDDVHLSGDEQRQKRIALAKIQEGRDAARS